MNNNILVTGAAGYIGSHAVIELIENGYEVIAVDNFSNSKKSVIHSIEKILGRKIIFYEADIVNGLTLAKIFDSHHIAAVVHFAGLKSVEESVNNSALYFKNNVAGSACLLDQMTKFNVSKIIFSSSATVYGDLAKTPITEDSSLNPINPYGETKVAVEELFTLRKKIDPLFSFINLRYFNPVGAHTSGLIGENPVALPTNLFPLVCRAAHGKAGKLSIFGGDYNTSDGTPIRDYIHVMDLVKGHSAALRLILSEVCDYSINLGTGKGTSVLEVINMFETATSYKIPYEIKDRRKGDAPISYADVKLSKKLLNWTAEKTLNQMCVDSWKWELNSSIGL
jgi:UDP-glucose 4-epimerase